MGRIFANMIYPENGSVSDYYLGKPFTINSYQKVLSIISLLLVIRKKIAYMLQLDSSDGLNADSFIFIENVGD